MQPVHLPGLIDYLILTLIGAEQAIIIRLQKQVIPYIYFGMGHDKHHHQPSDTLAHIDFTLFEYAMSKIALFIEKLPKLVIWLSEVKTNCLFCALFNFFTLNLKFTSFAAITQPVADRLRLKVLFL